MNKKITAVAKLLITSCIILSLQSCLVAAVGAGIGAYKWGDSKESEAETTCKKTYPTYFNEMEKMNKTKASRHEKATAIMTIEEYCHLEEKETTTNKTKANQK